MGIIEITPLLGSFGARYPHSLIITVKNADIAEKLVQKHAELVRKTTKRERSRLFKKFLYFLPDETKDRVTRLDARQDQLRKSNEIKGHKKTNFFYRWSSDNKDLVAPKRPNNSTSGNSKPLEICETNHSIVLN